MADIEIAPLTDRLTEDEIADVIRALVKVGVSKLPKGDEAGATTIAGGIDDDVLAEFLDHLEANDIACELYLPAEFDVRIEAADLRIGSIQTLVDVLEELREDLDIDEDKDEEDEEEAEEDYELSLVEKQIRQLWRFFYDGAHAALERHLSLFVTGG